MNQERGHSGCRHHGRWHRHEFCQCRHSVTLIEQSEDALKRGIDTIAKNYNVSATRGAISVDDVGKRLALISGSTDFSKVAEADMVIEAVFEDMALKKEIFEKLDKACKPGAILASNTSYLDINEIAAVTKRPRDVLGMHYFSPANVMKLLETVRGEKTAPDVVATAIAVGRKTGKVPVVVGCAPALSAIACSVCAVSKPNA